MKRVWSGILFLVALCGGCRNSGLPNADSKAYDQLCSAFYLGLAGLQSGEDVRAKEYLTKATQIAPGEPAAWVDLGILQVRQQQFDAAFGSVDKARSLAPDNSRIEALLGLIESRRGHLPEAASHLKKAIALDPHNIKAMYALAGELERDGGTANQDAAQQLLKGILQLQPGNTAALLDDLRLAAKRGDTAEAQRASNAVQPHSGEWPDVARQQFANLQQAASGPNVRAAAVRVQFLRNVLMRVPGYREDADQLQIPATLVARPFTRFLRLPSRSSQPAIPDEQTHFDVRPVPGGSPKASWIGSVALNDQGQTTTAWTDDTNFHLMTGATLPLPGPQAARLAPTAIAAADLNYDFKTDITIATASGVRIYQQDDPAHFHDITAEVKLPKGIANGAYTGVWAFDIDLDGDLDLVLGVAHGDPVILRNNGDGTFTPIDTFKGVEGLTAFAAADLDGDGDPDVALVDGNGNLHVFLNERLGSYKPLPTPSNLSAGIRAIAAADINGDGIMDLVALNTNGTVTRLSLKPESYDWETATVIHAAGSSSLLLADVDNNGALDVVVDGQVFLNDGNKWSTLPAELPGTPEAFADLDNDGRLDLLALTRDGAPVELINRGSKRYNWQVIRTRAAHATGDQRINSFGLGGEIEIRSDLLAEKQIIDSPILHFGLGEHKSVQFARIVWPNGFVQAEFDLGADQTILAEQRIKGSCPMLFTWDGRSMQFLKDVGPWGSALGLNVNAQGKGIYGTREWFNIRANQLVPRNGFYDLRITAEYWETYYMDHYSLLAIDHPADSEVYTDERFALPSPSPNLIGTTVTKPFVRATDQHGTDVTEIVRNLDNNFLGTFCLGQYQGLAEPHWVELELPADAPAHGPLYLIGQGWIHDTDATIVKAQAQNSKAHPEGMSIQVPDATGRWVTAREGLGFPKGRIKTVILDISNIFRPGAPRKLRLSTNLELYWDKLAWGAGLPADEHLDVKHLSLAAADLRFRGFSLITKANTSSPELPHYDDVRESDLRWRDQEGYATRYGDVRPLLTEVDDRYVITSPGDELRMKFAALPDPAPGTKRDFVLICDGWVKDADYNSTFSSTILPLPYHAMTDYVVPATTLEADHAYEQHPDDWQTYQTRYVSPHQFNTTLWSR